MSQSVTESAGAVEQLALCETAREEASSKPPRARTARSSEPTAAELDTLARWGWVKLSGGFWKDPSGGGRRRWDSALKLIAKGEARGDLPGDVATAEPANDVAMPANDTVAEQVVPEPAPLHGATVLDYTAFLRRKSQLDSDGGFAPVWMPSFLFDFQAALTEWNLRRGRSAMFADCGMGKTPMFLVWAENVVRHTNGRVLVLTPLAVVKQTLREAEKFGVSARRSDDGTAHPGITVTNYEKLHLFDPTEFVGVVGDESGILKSFEGVTRMAVTEFLRRMPYRLLDTATAAPNDYVELGTHSEALGYLGHADMLGRFFRNEHGTAQGKSAFAADGGRAVTWRFKGHAEEPFWRWVCSWARALRRPSDLGFDDGSFVLPPLVEREHRVTATRPRDGLLFSVPAQSLAEQREERRRTMVERCERAASLVRDTGRPAVAWCHLNPEGDLLERLIPGAVQVSGRDDDAAKEEKFGAFARGECRVLVIKPVIGAWGLNWQHCAHMVTFASHSFEQHYQSVRRFWRFGQPLPVVCDHVISDGEGAVLANLQRKAAQADVMFARLVQHMRDGMAVARDQTFNVREQVPSWL